MPDPLPSRNEGVAKSAVRDFVARVTKDGGPDCVPPAERIAPTLTASRSSKVGSTRMAICTRKSTMSHGRATASQAATANFVR